MRNRLSLLCAGLLFVLPAGYLTAESVFGGETRLSASLLVYSDGTDLVNSISGFGDFSLFLNAWSDTVDFYFEPRITLDYTDGPSVSVDQLYLEYFPADFVSFKAGRFFHLPGSADFFSVTNFFHGYDFETLLTGDLGGAVIPNDMFQISFYVASLYGRITFSPFPGELLMIDSDSPWFPDTMIPASVSMEEDGATVNYDLNSVETETSLYPEPELKYFTISGEIGATLSVFDIWAGYYHGVDHDTVFRAEVTTFDFLSDHYYDLSIYPVITVQDVFGLSTAFSLGGFRFQAEGAFTLAKSFSTDEINIFGRSILEENPCLEVTAGISYTFENPSLRLSAEYTDGWAFSSEYNHLTMPTSSLITVMMNISFFDTRLNWTEVFIIEVDEWSFILNSRLVFSLTDTLAIELVYPFFYGSADSAFGQYRRNYPVSFTLSWKF